MTDRTVYIMFLKGQRNQPDNKYVGVTTLSLGERLKVHKQAARSVRLDGKHNSRLYRMMREKGLENWEIAPLAELWLTTQRELFELEKYYIRLLGPDLNVKNGSSR